MEVVCLWNKEVKHRQCGAISSCYYNLSGPFLKVAVQREVKMKLLK